MFVEFEIEGSPPLPPFFGLKLKLLQHMPSPHRYQDILVGRRRGVIWAILRNHTLPRRSLYHQARQTQSG